MYKKWLKTDVSCDFGDVDKICFCHCTECDLKFFYPLITGSEDMYEKLQQFEWYYREDKAEYNYAKTFIKNSDCILEVGCGKGAFARKINSKEYVGLELSQKALAVASEEQHGVFKKETVEEHAIVNPGHYDVLCAFQVLEHVGGVHSFITSCITCLKPGGLLIYSVPSADSYLAIVHNGITNMPPHHVTWWSYKALNSIASIFGMKLKDIQHQEFPDRLVRSFASHIILSSLENMFNLKHLLIDRSVRHRVLAKIASLGGKLLEKSLSDPKVLPRGPSLTVIYSKPEAAS